MMSYMDMTFCTYYETCSKAKTCFRPLTPEVRKQADKWWGAGKDGAPIAIFSEKPSCHKENNNE